MLLSGWRRSGAVVLAMLAVWAMTASLLVSPMARAMESAAMRAAPVEPAKRPRAAKGQGERLRRADLDHDGYLSRAEVQHALPRLAMHFDAIDANRDGKLSAQEIRNFGRSKGAARVAGSAGPGRGGAPALRGDAAFIAADADGDGQLSRAEAAALPRVASKFARMDANGDGQLSAGEFRAWIARRKAARAAKP